MIAKSVASILFRTCAGRRLRLHNWSTGVCFDILSIEPGFFVIRPRGVEHTSQNEVDSGSHNVFPPITETIPQSQRLAAENFEFLVNSSVLIGGRQVEQVFILLPPRCEHVFDDQWHRCPLVQAFPVLGHDRVRVILSNLVVHPSPSDDGLTLMSYEIAHTKNLSATC